LSKSNRAGLVRTGLAVWDALTWAVAALGLVLTRYNFVLTGEQTQIVLIYAASAMMLQIAIGFATKLYRGRHGIASFEETALLAVVALGIGTRRERRAQASLSLPDRLPAQELP